MFKQLAKNLRKAGEAHEEDRKASRDYGDGHSEISYAAVRTGRIVSILTEGILLGEFDESQLTEEQRQWFANVRQVFPYVGPREMEEDGGVIFHGHGWICRLSPDAKNITRLGEAPCCPECAEQIMAKVDAGNSTAQCHNCGKAVTVEPSDE